MVILFLGVALWWVSHLFKRIAPKARRSMGQRGRAMVTAGLVLSILLMVWGYQIAEPSRYLWGPTPMLKGINNLLVLVGFYLFAASGMKTGITRRIRHPQLVGFSLWAFAHLLVRGDSASILLFGGLLLWAIVTIVVINRSGERWTPAHPVPVRKEAMAAVGALLVYGVVGLLHMWLGPNPFGA